MTFDINSQLISIYRCFVCLLFATYSVSLCQHIYNVLMLRFITGGNQAVPPLHCVVPKHISNLTIYANNFTHQINHVHVAVFFTAYREFESMTVWVRWCVLEFYSWLATTRPHIARLSSMFLDIIWSYSSKLHDICTRFDGITCCWRINQLMRYSESQRGWSNTNNNSIMSVAIIADYSAKVCIWILWEKLVPWHSLKLILHYYSTAMKREV